MSQPLIYGHRGARAHAPENTLPSFQTAFDMGADGIELDVHMSKDGCLVVIHDFTLERTTDGHGSVSDFTAAELARLDAGSHYSPAFAGAGVPTLEEALDLAAGRSVNVEIKSMDPFGGPEADAVAALIRSRNLYDAVIVSSFNPVTLIKMRWVDRRVRLGLLYSADLPIFLRQAWTGPLIQPEALHPEHDMIDAGYMDAARRMGVAVNTWTVNDPDEARRLAELGVDIIITDAPDRIRAALAAPR